MSSRPDSIACMLTNAMSVIERSTTAYDYPSHHRILESVKLFPVTKFSLPLSRLLYSSANQFSKAIVIPYYYHDTAIIFL